MPNRIIKESIRESYSIDKLSFGAECTFYRLMTYADDYGIFKADARLINKALFPLKKLKDSDVAGYMNEISQSGMVLYYLGSDGKPYGFFKSWHDHNTPRNTKSKYPQPNESNVQYFNDINSLLKAFECNCKQLNADAPLIQSNPISNTLHPPAPANGKKSKSHFTPPQIDDVILFFKDKGYPENLAKRAFEHYSLADWKDSKGSQVKNWKQKMFSVWMKPENKNDQQLSSPSSMREY